jgi:DNA-directed RNA polymerase specialized sigma24 family protein
MPEFERKVLPHLHAAYNLARWLTHNKQDAEDVVRRFQEFLKEKLARSTLILEAARAKP